MMYHGSAQQYVVRRSSSSVDENALSVCDFPIQLFVKFIGLLQRHALSYTMETGDVTLDKHLPDRVDEYISQ
jgi:hypothetical protein